MFVPGAVQVTESDFEGKLPDPGTPRSEYTAEQNQLRKEQQLVIKGFSWRPLVEEVGEDGDKVVFVGPHFCRTRSHALRKASQFIARQKKTGSFDVSPAEYAVARQKKASA